MKRWGAILVAVWLVFASAVIGVRVMNGRAFDTDIQSLLPSDALEPVIRAAMRDAGDAAARRVAVLISADEPMQAMDAGADLERRLAESGVFQADRADGEAMGRWLFANRNELLCEFDPAQFDGDAAARRALAMIYAPTAPISGELLRNDPFLRTLTLSQCLAPAVGGEIGDATLVSGRLTESAFRLDTQDKFGAVLEEWRAHWPNVKVARAGAVFHAEAGSQQAQREVSLIGGVSLAAITLLMIFCFLRAEALAGTMAVTAASAIGSLGAALLIFPTVHVLVFVFGSALIGITSDYAVHYLATGPQSKWEPLANRVKHVKRPLIVCAAATSIGFASLVFFNVPIFTQVAVFSVAGVLTALAFTLTLLPLMDIRARNPEKVAAWWAKVEAPLAKIKWTKARLIIASVVLVLAVIAGAMRFSTLDDVRQFQPRSPVLTAEEAEVRAATGYGATPKFLLSFGANPDEARRREETSLAALPLEAARDVLATSRFDPSAERRAQNKAALEQRLYGPHLAAQAAQIGIDLADAPVTISMERPKVIAALAGAAGDVAYLVAPLGPVAENAAELVPDATVVDPAARYSRAFAAYRGYATWAFLAAFAVCAGVILLIYRTPHALSILAGPAIGVIAAVAVPAAFGVPVSFFTVIALFVVIGTGIDHSVFQWEAAESGGEPMELAVFIAALTTVLSMGLLGLSGTYPVRAFGLAVAAGVTVGYVFSFIPARVAGSVRHANHQD
ncbi:MAG: hypothetical protein ABW199_05295 [Caulobacterales bacterium]